MDKSALWIVLRGRVAGVSGGVGWRGFGGGVGWWRFSGPYSANQRVQRATGPKRKGQSCVSAVLCLHSGH